MALKSMTLVILTDVTETNKGPPGRPDGLRTIKSAGF
jgi:hypothetical protein